MALALPKNGIDHPHPTRFRAHLVAAVLGTVAFLYLVFYIPWVNLHRTSSQPIVEIEHGQGHGHTAVSRQNAAIVMLVSPKRMGETLRTLHNVEDRFNRRLKYPYVLLTEANITSELRDKIDWITEGRASFGELPSDMWGKPDWLDQEKVDESIKNLGFTLNYRSMCRFYSGFFWRHPALLKYDWIWRLDTDIVFHCDIPYDPIARMAEEGKLYGFTQIVGDALYVQPSLASNVSYFLNESRHLLAPGANIEFSWKDVDKALRGEATSKDWTIAIMYNNFEISHRSIWESPLYQAFFDYLDKAGGFFYERWGDAPVHSFGVGMVLRKDQAMQFRDLDELLVSGLAGVLGFWGVLFYFIF
ncbi:hypothetical protein AX16_007042 [Volvariella volvacea WC 439]|nr:hypothetical protein AX16_007042 [Volvariella volvacea WC 439]